MLISASCVGVVGLGTLCLGNKLPLASTVVGRLGDLPPRRKYKKEAKFTLRISLTRLGQLHCSYIPNYNSE